MRFNKLLTRLNCSQKAYTLIELLVIIGLLGVVAAVAIPNIMKFMNRGEEESKHTEQDNVQLVVQLLLIDADEEELDNDYDEVQTLAQIQQVTAGGGTYSLDNYLYVFTGSNQFTQAYDISKQSIVTVD